MKNDKIYNRTSEKCVYYRMKAHPAIAVPQEKNSHWKAEA